MLRNAIKTLANIHSVKIIVLGYLFYALVGWLVLLLPICHKQEILPLDNLFTAVSAMSTTGLTTIDIGTKYSIFGQIVILLLIQTGGIGYMTFNTFIVLSTTNKLSHFRKKIASTTFSLPKEFNIREFIFHAVIFTVACELIGAIFLSIVFLNNGVDNCVWNGIFHSISAFCTAGFALFPDSLMSFKYHFGITFFLSTLSLLGAVGFITWLDFYKKITKQKEHLLFTTKVILSVTFGFLIFGTLVFFLTEDLLKAGSLYDQLITAFFQVMSASTTVGFNSLDIGTLKQTTILLLIFLMIFGASPAGTGGGLKSTTFTALIGLVKSTFKGENVVSIWKRIIPVRRLQLATSIFSYYAFLLALSTSFLILLENKPFLSLLFEAASALGTVGLSMGITGNLTAPSKALISLLMFMGKIGILTFGIALASQDKEEIEFKKDNDLVF